MTLYQLIWVRCSCCGVWQWLAHWDNHTRHYCEGCRVESDPAWRIGPGKGQCQYHIEYPERMHWDDPRPTKPGPTVFVCIR